MIAALLLLVQAAVPLPAPAETIDPLKTLKGTVVDAIRDCGVAPSGQIRVCSRDRGFAETVGDRLPKLVRPKPVANDPLVTVQVTGPSAPPASPTP